MLDVKLVVHHITSRLEKVKLAVAATGHKPNYDLFNLEV